MKLLNDWIHIRLDPDQEKVGDGVLYKPDGAYEHVLRTAEVIAVGPGRWCESGEKRVPIDLKPGDGVVFIRFVADGTKTGQAIQAILGKDEALIRSSDVLLVYDRGDAPRFS